MNEHIVIVTGASPVDDRVAAGVPAEAIVIGADAGFDLALAAGLRPFGLIGDLDSISDEGLAWAEEHATIARHPSDKDATDTELALAFAADMHPERLTMIGGGERLDHTLAALGALGSPKLTGVPMIDAWWNGQHVDVLHGPQRRTLHLVAGSTLSLLVFGRRCEDVHIDGVRWPLDGATLEPVVGLGMSNEVLDDPDVTVAVTGGVLHVFDVPAHPTPDSDGAP